MSWLISILSDRLLKMVFEFLARRNDNDAEVSLKQIDAELAARRSAREIRLATSGYWEMRVLTFLIALPFVVHLNMVALDTSFSLGWGIPAFPKPFDEWEGKILLSFFGVYAVCKGLATLSGVLSTRR